ncbi:MAG: Ig domain-containing protein [Planctomycetota bacterium]|jgi:hypothetical protein
MRAGYLVPLLVLVVACGGGGGGGETAQLSSVTIQTESLQPGNVGLAYTQTLRAAGGDRNYSWWISTAGDSLPNGLSLSSDGMITGTPTRAAVRSIVVVAEDGNAEIATRTLRLETRDIEITGATGGALQPGSVLSLSASGGSASYEFTLSVNGSGADISQSGSYTAGDSVGVDVIRATDAEGFFDEVAVTVGQDPFAGFVARWGTSDVWWVSWDVLYDDDPVFAYDFDSVLAELGFRHATSTGVTGTQEDQLAKALIQRRTLGYLSMYYGNTFDGAAGSGGLPISFVKPSGPSQGTLPGAGSVSFPGPMVYNAICVRNSNTGTTIGTAYLDNNNSRIEHNCGDPGSLVLGVFANRLVGPFRTAMGNGIRNDPITAADIPALESLLNGNAPVGSREQAIFQAADRWSRVLAAVIAHEIGHSLGLTHSSGGTASDIMNSSLQIAPSIFYAFNGAHWAQLQGALPGPNR